SHKKTSSGAPASSTSTGSASASVTATSTQALLEELSAQDPDASTMTRWSPPQPAGFWFRRMALEVAVHRYDAELTHGVPTPIDAGPAADGVDEALRIFLGGRPWRDTGTDEPLDAR